ncbi:MULTISPECIES: hypothetical protein [Moorena]|uniref:Uncharacterized protein n=1 Tax=Moorena producens 3L TaxID=489825 RepID=F4Y1T6_9CYAN|nr:MULTISPECIES: hypothetical protein [Moorena]NEQ18315.1 hypothetical protein [Moorena sp. SIO3E2]EGJ29228.1 hypothetical protein LYNGBM3L_64720 [Moorena producens 3L]NEP35843.1 hypothetical protein [Moorena sp. SIO3B2]NEP67437.1 hypothetical protein [Moorena sp. SIO3A5]NEQ08563.1 hypothetical protein [Moorena sp. SIO4E2]
MTKSLLKIYPLGHLSLALVEWVLLAWAIRLWRRSTSLAMIVLPIVLASISYDNLVLAMGSLIGEGDLLKSLSMVRFLLHFLVVPLFIVIAVELAHRAGAVWANTIVRVFSWVLALGLGGFEVATQFVGLELVPVTFAGTLRYTVAEVSAPPIVTILVNLFVLLIGIGIWVRLKWPWLFVGTLVALIGNAVPISRVGTLVGSASEFVMALSLLLTERRTQFVRAQLGSGEKTTKVEGWVEG